jgi:hypothetical protein
MTPGSSPRLDCLPLAPNGPQDAPHARAQAGVGGREKAARRASFQLFASAHRTPGSTRNSEGRNAA